MVVTGSPRCRSIPPTLRDTSPRDTKELLSELRIHDEPAFYGQVRRVRSRSMVIGYQSPLTASTTRTDLMPCWVAVSVAS